jgi:hypothetical protein
MRVQERSPGWPSESVASREMVASMSAAVVPRAKLEATIVQGPALPFMERPEEEGCVGVREEGVEELRAWLRRLPRSR